MTQTKGKTPRQGKRTGGKKSWKPGNMLSPVPVVLVSCGGTKGWKPNLITIAWIGSVCSDPPMLSISVRPERYSHDIIKTTGEFVVNVPSADQAKTTDWCGVVSGRETDKFSAGGITAAPALKVGCPIVAECPLNIECRIKKSLPLGSHTLFLAQVVAVQKAGLIAYAHGHYFALGRHLGHFGFSVRKTKKNRRG
jgi:flavin reductase (DIM6/NTAB) family NADH-FMN oxidoreductase RutF